MSLSRFILVANHDGKRLVLWSRLFFRALLAALAAVILFIGGYVLWFVFAQPNSIGILETWCGEKDHFTLGLLQFAAVVVFLVVVLPLLWSLFLPVARLPDVAVAGGSNRLGRLALFGLACLATLVALFYTEEDWRGKRAWEQYKRQLEAKGERLDLAAFIPPPVADGENFAMTPRLAPLYDFKPGTLERRDTNALQRVEAFSQRLWSAQQKMVWRERLELLSPWARPRTDLQAWYAAFLQATKAPSVPRWKLIASGLTATNFARSDAAAGVLAALSECDPLIEELRTAARRPHCRFNIPYNQEMLAAAWLPHHQVLPSAASILELRASAELVLGRTNAAFEDLLLIFKLADAFRDEPFVDSLIMRIQQLMQAVQPLAEGLAGHQWSEPQLQAIEEWLGHLDLVAESRRALQAECVVSGIGTLDSFRQASDKRGFLARLRLAGHFGAPSSAEGKEIEVCLAAAPVGWSYLEQLNLCRGFQQQFLPAFDVPNHRIALKVIENNQARVGQELSRPAFGSSAFGSFLRHEIFLRLVPCGFLRFNLARLTANRQTQVDEAAVACALERYRLAQGEFPDALDALRPRFIEKLPLDVCNGQPLKYHRLQADQYVLYAVGQDGADHGGSPRRDQMW
jgi:hypothetical protein